MDSELRPYPEYKDTGLPWLGRVPVHWDVRASKRLFRESSERAAPDDDQLSATQAYGVIRQEDYERRIGRKVVRIVSHLDKRKHVEKDDFVISMRSFQGGIERAWSRGAIRSSYVVLKPENSVHVPYFAHLFKSYPYIHALRRTSEFIRDGQDLTFWNFSQVPLPIVPPGEQKAIANYLDAISSKINRFIRNRRRLIEVLNEQKQAIINRAVTRGLDPDAPLKPSGIEWLGEIPEHWTVKPLKRWASINQKVLSEKTTPDYIFDYFDIGCIGTGILVKSPERICFRESPSRARRVVNTGDSIISTVRTYLRTIYFFKELSSDCIASTGFAVLTPSKEIFPEYLGIALQSDYFVNQITANSTGIAYPAIAESKIGTFNLAVPHSEEEQLEIAKHIRKETFALKNLINRTQREITLIREYRTRLIADVVTGQVDVRHLAPTGPLPADALDETLDDDALLDETETTLDEDAAEDEA